MPSDYETTSSENQLDKISPPTSLLPPPPPHHPTSPTSSPHQTLPFETDATIVNEPPRPTLVDTGSPILAGIGGPSQGQLKPRLSSVTSKGGTPISLASIGGGVPSPTSGTSGAQQGADALVSFSSFHENLTQGGNGNARIAGPASGGEELPPIYDADDDRVGRAKMEAEQILAREREAKKGV